MRGLTRARQYTGCTLLLRIPNSTTGAAITPPLKQEVNMNARFDYSSASANYRSGCKVCWYYYASEHDAIRASEQAKVDAVARYANGFDAGYQCPGSIGYMDRGEYAGLWEVCVL